MVVYAKTYRAFETWGPTDKARTRTRCAWKLGPRAAECIDTGVLGIRWAMCIEDFILVCKYLYKARDGRLCLGRFTVSTTQSRKHSVGCFRELFCCFYICTSIVTFICPLLNEQSNRSSMHIEAQPPCIPVTLVVPTPRFSVSKTTHPRFCPTSPVSVPRRIMRSNTY